MRSVMSRRRPSTHAAMKMIKNRERLLEGDLAAKLLGAVLAQPRVKRLLSTDHFSVDGTLVEAWASMKSFRPKDGLDGRCQSKCLGCLRRVSLTS
jgi:hypothetical protein